MPKPSRLSRFLPAAFVVAAMVGFWSLGLHRYVSLQSVVDNRDALLAAVEAHGILALLVFALVYAGAVAISFPGASFLTIAAGFLFGTWIGGATVVIAATTGATLVFLAARTSLGEGMSSRAGPFLAKLAEGFRGNAFSYLLALRLAPVFPFWLVNLAPALLGVNLRTYVGATVLGIIPGTFAFAAIGSGLDSVIAAQKAVFDACVAAGTSNCHLTVDPRALVTSEILLALGGLALVSIIPPAVRLLKARQAHS